MSSWANQLVVFLGVAPSVANCEDEVYALSMAGRILPAIDFYDSLQDAAYPTGLLVRHCKEGRADCRVLMVCGDAVYQYGG